MSSSATEGKTASRRKRGSSSRTGSAGSASSGDNQRENGAFVCPECGQSFGRAQALGAHRSRKHGVPGSSRAARSSSARKSTGKTATAKRSAATRGTASGRNVAASRGSQSTASASSRRSRSARSDGNQFDRDKLLGVLFPEGVPAKVGVIEALTPWLDEAERLSRMR